MPATRFLLAAALLLLAGCSARPELDLLEGTAWTLAQYRDAAGFVVEDAYGTLAFRTSQVALSSCNDCGAAYATEDHVLRLGLGACTERLCAAGLTFELGAVLLEVRRARYALEDGGDALRLDLADGGVMTFERLDAAAAQP